jgi:hypothetical protein
MILKIIFKINLLWGDAAIRADVRVVGMVRGSRGRPAPPQRGQHGGWRLSPLFQKKRQGFRNNTTCKNNLSPLAKLARVTSRAQHLVLEHHEGVNGLHATSCREDQQGIDVEFGEMSIELHGQVGDLYQGLRQGLDVRCRPPAEAV